jgi:hypothetical protein
MKMDSISSDSYDSYDCVCLEDGRIGSDWGEVVTLVEATIQYYIK